MPGVTETDSTRGDRMDDLLAAAAGQCVCVWVASSQVWQVVKCVEVCVGVWGGGGTAAVGEWGPCRPAEARRGEGVSKKCSVQVAVDKCVLVALLARFACTQCTWKLCTRERLRWESGGPAGPRRQGQGSEPAERCSLQVVVEWCALVALLAQLACTQCA